MRPLPPDAKSASGGGAAGATVLLVEGLRAGLGQRLVRRRHIPRIEHHLAQEARREAAPEAAAELGEDLHGERREHCGEWAGREGEEEWRGSKWTFRDEDRSGRKARELARAATGGTREESSARGKIAAEREGGGGRRLGSALGSISRRAVGERLPPPPARNTTSLVMFSTTFRSSSVTGGVSGRSLREMIGRSTGRRAFWRPNALA